MASNAKGGGVSRNRNQLFSKGVGVAITNYVKQMLGVVKGMKALLLDRHTKAIISGVLTQTQCCEMDAYIIQDITNKKQRPLPLNLGHLEAVVFMRPCQESLEAIRTHLADPRFKKYHLFFTNIIQSGYLSEIAHVDKHEVVASVQEYYADFLPVNWDLFTLDIKNSVGLHTDSPEKWRIKEKRIYDQNVNGLRAVLLALKTRPAIRYAKHSTVCRSLAHDITETIKANMTADADSFSWQEPTNPPMLLILDRRDDPITPLLTQWTYQAMVHEILGVHNSRIDMSSAKDIRKEYKEAVLNPFDDQFYRDNMMMNFGELNDNLKSIFDKFQANAHTNQNISSMKDMQRFIEDYPQFVAERTHVSKHMAIVPELSRQIGTRKLMDISRVEQDIVSAYNPKDDLDKVLGILGDPQATFEDKLRLMIIYVLRYEESSRSSSLPRLRAILTEEVRKVDGDDPPLEHPLRDSKPRLAIARNLVDTILRYCGEGHRGGIPVFEAKNVLQRLTSSVAEVENVFTQHKTLLETTLDHLMAGRLSTKDYPYFDGQRSKSASNQPPQDLIVFMFGGTTYEEAAMIRTKNESAPKDGARIILGGSYVHNSRTFLDDVARNFPTVTHDQIQIGVNR